MAMLIKRVRGQSALIQEDLAREIGVSCATGNRWENGQYRPSTMALTQIEAYFDPMIEMGRLLPDERRLSKACTPNRYVGMLLILGISVK